MDSDCDRMKLGLGSNEVDGTRIVPGAGILDTPTGVAGTLDGLGICASILEGPGRGMTFCILEDKPMGVLRLGGLINPGGFSPDGGLMRSEI